MIKDVVEVGDTSCAVQRAKKTCFLLMVVFVTQAAKDSSNVKAFCYVLEG
ncbi:hypothetical protein YC2023_052450 [Brassica napus]